ncbi:6014_t:CDS:2 [Funneliformis caledonium]|uniref:6014_t:CDS:1 n=1 Tax=Funneliformis caledonium TaxID=1117310 RepID=A0A9N8VCJ4_9GLOM|nr:6014_t:CDS:2 [Funneliformis caledonium]
MSPKHQIYLDRAEFVRSLLNDTTTANILLRVDNFHIYAHTTILYCASGFFKKIFKILAHKDDERRIEYLFHDYSCNKEIAITRLHEYKGQENVELLYDRVDFQNFVAFIYGYPIKTNDQDQLFVLAYLACKHKFDVPELVDFCDNILYKIWNEQRWHVILRVSKWLGLKKLRCRVLQYVYNRGELMFQGHAKKDLDERDWQIMFVLSNGKDPLLVIDSILDGTYDDPQENFCEPRKEN